MAILTYAEQLEEVQRAISAIIGTADRGGAQSYSFEGRSVTRADLGALQEREVYLRRMYARELGGGGIRGRLGVPT